VKIYEIFSLEFEKIGIINSPLVSVNKNRKPYIGIYHKQTEFFLGST
jgi:hypothetical protein